MKILDCRGVDKNTNETVYGELTVFCAVGDGTDKKGLLTDEEGKDHWVYLNTTAQWCNHRLRATNEKVFIPLIALKGYGEGEPFIT